MATHEIVMGFGVEPEDRLHLTKVPGWEERTVNLVSGLSHTYRDVVRLPEGLSAVAGPEAGDRAPDAKLLREPRKRVYDLCRHPGFTVLAIPGKAREQDLASFSRLSQELEAKFGASVSVFLIAEDERAGFDMDHCCADETGEVLERYGIGDEGRLVVIRPDLFIGLTCLPKDGNLIGEYMEQWFPARAKAGDTANTGAEERLGETVG